MQATMHALGHRDRLPGFYHVELGVPVMDPSIAALKRAEWAAQLRRDCGWKPSRKGSCEPPPEADIARLGVFDTDTPFGGREVVRAGRDAGERMAS